MRQHQPIAKRNRGSLRLRAVFRDPMIVGWSPTGAAPRQNRKSVGWERFITDWFRVMCARNAKYGRRDNWDNLALHLLQLCARADVTQAPQSGVLGGSFGGGPDGEPLND